MSATARALLANPNVTQECFIKPSFSGQCDDLFIYLFIYLLIFNLIYLIYLFIDSASFP